VSLALGAGLLVWILAGPWIQAPLLAWLGVRGVAAVSLAWALAGLVAGRPAAVPAALDLGRAPFAGVVVLTALSLATGSRLGLLLLPAWIYTAFAVLFWRSRSRYAGGVIGVLARLVEHYAPDFIDPYCNKLTAIWAGVFAASALLVAGSALAAPLESWTFVSGAAIYAGMAALQAVEYVVRKLWFRNYKSGPLDRVLARWFPAEATARGRRSVAYIREMRARHGLPPYQTGSRR
jgi:uncharacterized membrane protein